MRLRFEVLLVVLAVAAAACGSTTDTGSALPDGELWTDENPQPSEGIPLHLIVEFFVGPGLMEHRCRLLVVQVALTA